MATTMGMPGLNLVFQQRAAESLSRSQRGVVALIVRDAADSGALALGSAADIPAGLTEKNRAYIARAFTGYVNCPTQVLCYVLGAEAENLTAALEFLATQEFDYLAGPPECDADDALEIATWIAEQRERYAATYKAVLPKCEADDEAVVNFVADDLVVNGVTLDGAEYCARIAGMLAGVPLTYSCTHATLDEVSDAARLTRAAMDEAVDAGKLIVYANGRTTRLGRAVNSLTSGGDSCRRKVKIIAALDMIQRDLRDLIEGEYIGKYSNSYDNRLVLLTAISEYLDTMVRAQVIRDYEVALDLEATADYLRSTGVDVSAMSEQELKAANTGSRVFLTGSLSMYDAIEDIVLNLDYGL